MTALCLGTGAVSAQAAGVDTEEATFSFDCMMPVNFGCQVSPPPSTAGECFFSPGTRGDSM